MHADSEQVSQFVTEVFHAQGEAQNIAGNKPFLLNQADSIWYIDQGSVEIFTVGVSNGKSVGTRSHFMSRTQGQCLVCIDSGKYQMGFLAVGIIGTRLYRLSLSLLQELANRPDYSQTIAKMIDDWVMSVSESLVRDIVPYPTSDHNLGHDDCVILRQLERTRSKKGVLWINVVAGDLLFLDMESLFLADSEIMFPLTPQTWVQSTDESKLSARPSVSVIDRVAVWKGLAAFHEALCVCEFLNKRLLNVDEIHRLSTKADYSDEAINSALQNIASVLNPDIKSLAKLGSVGGDDLVLTTCRFIGDYLGIEIRAHPDLWGEKELAIKEKLAAISKSSRFRMRPVAMRGDWYTKDVGPIFCDIDDSPVALLPVSMNAYECINPTANTRVPVDEQLTSTLNPFGMCIYRPFRDGDLKPFDLIKFGIRGLNRDIFYLISMGILLGVFGSLTPYFTGQIFDSVIPQAERELLYQFLLALVVIAFASTSFTIVQKIAVLRIQGKMDFSIQAALWDRLLNLPSTFFRQYSVGDLADRVAGINRIRGLLAGAGVSAILGSMSSLFYVVLMFYYSSSLAIVAIGLTLFFLTFTIVSNLIQLRHQRRQLNMAGKITGLVLQLINGVAKVRVSGAEDYAFCRWSRDFGEYRQVSFKLGFISNIMTLFNSVFPIISSMMIYLALMIFMDSENPTTMSIGEFIAFNSAYGLFLAAMMALSNASLDFLRVIPLYERLRPIVSTPTEVSEDRTHPGKLSGNIEVSHLHFRYDPDGPLIIDNVSFTIKPGEFVAFVGGSGSGKSTLLRLLMGFEIPSAGTIYYDNQDLNSLDLREVRQQLGVVLQDSKLLPTDIYRNIVGTSSLTVDDAWEAAHMAGLSEDIKQMPMGMHTMVSEGGGTFSGGQRQRLMIARAIIHKPRILFLDEATSALDNRTQAQVTESLDKMQATRIVIAHRLSTIINADRIYVLDKGFIKENGTYDQLVAEDGIFADLVKRQSL